jgi:hypothetical protein
MGGDVDLSYNEDSSGPFGDAVVAATAAVSPSLEDRSSITRNVPAETYLAEDNNMSDNIDDDNNDAIVDDGRYDDVVTEGSSSSNLFGGGEREVTADTITTSSIIIDNDDDNLVSTYVDEGIASGGGAPSPSSDNLVVGGGSSTLNGADDAKFSRLQVDVNTRANLYGMDMDNSTTRTRTRNIEFSSDELNGGVVGDTLFDTAMPCDSVDGDTIVSLSLVPTTKLSDHVEAIPEIDAEIRPVDDFGDFTSFDGADGAPAEE